MVSEAIDPDTRQRDQRPRPYQARDARGRPVTLLDPYVLDKLRRYDVVPAEPLRRIADELGSGLKRELRGFVRVLVVVVVFCTLVFLIRVIDLSLSSNFVGIFDIHSALLLQPWLWVLLIWHLARLTRFKHVRAVMLEHRRCPHCGYDIRNLPTAPTDDATICPECGCAWKLEDACVT
jgi:hypothetical protein